MTDPKVSTTTRAPVHVGVNLLWLVPGVVGGSEEYTTRLLRAVSEAGPSDVRITLFALESLLDAHPDLAERFDIETIAISGHSKPRRVAAEVTWLSRRVRRGRLDVLHHAGGVMAPTPGLRDVANVLTIHDLQPLLMPENFSALKRRWLATMLPRSAAHADLIVTPSEPASRSVIDHLAVDASRVQTVPHGVEPPEPVDEATVAEARRRYRIDGPMILYPAITYPHKDHVTLVEAFASVARTRPEVTLVLTGGAGPSEAAVVDAIVRSGVGAQVRRTGRVRWPDLHTLYAAATAVAVPSHFEGFGAPALEAMAAGVPLVAADATALPWVAGDAALLVPVGDVAGWAEALAALLDDPRLVRERGAAGRARSAAFGWGRAADALLRAYRRAAAQ